MQIKALAVLAAAVALNANAGAVYHYTGPNFTQIEDEIRPAGMFDLTMRVSGQFEIAAPLAPNTLLTDFTSQILSFSFSNGRRTLNELTADASTFFLFGTDASGQIDRWVISVQLNQALNGAEDIEIDSLNAPDDGFQPMDRGQIVVCREDPPAGICHSLADQGIVENSPGHWTFDDGEVNVPEPPSTALSALGVLALLGLRRRPWSRERLS